MTIDERKERFFRFHGPRFRKLKASDMWIDLMELVRAHDPGRQLASVEISVLIKADASPILLGNSRGFNTCMNIFEELEPPSATSEPEATFEEERQ